MNPGQSWMNLSSFPFWCLRLSWSLDRYRLLLAGDISLRLDRLGLLRCEYLLYFGEQVRLAIVRNADVVGENKAQGEAG